MFNLHARFIVIMTAISISLSSTVNANVLTTPALEIGPGTGGSISGDTATLTINGTATSIITGFGLPVTYIDIPDVEFLLTATRGSDTTASNNGIDYLFNDGTITAGQYINTTFLTLIMSESSGFASFSADLANGGRIEGGFMLSGNLSSNFEGSFLTAKASTVIPVPSAVWLFGSGLLGLYGFTRRIGIN